MKSVERKAWSVVLLLLLTNVGFGQDLTSYYEIKLRAQTTGALVGGKDVDLYQGAVKIYDLIESATTPGVYYYNTVAVGEYDIYVNSSSFKNGVFIGANVLAEIAAKFSTVLKKFTVDSVVTNYLSAGKVLLINKQLAYDSIALWDGDSTLVDTLDVIGNGKVKQMFALPATGTPEGWLDIYVPDWTTKIDSILVWGVANSIAGDSVALNLLACCDRSEGETINLAITGTTRDTLDMGTLVYAQKIFRFVPSLPIDDYVPGSVRIAIQRDNTIANNMAARFYPYWVIIYLN